MTRLINNRFRLVALGLAAAGSALAISFAIVTGQGGGATGDATPTLTVAELSTRQAWYQPTVTAFQRTVVDELVNKRESVAGAPRGEHQFLSRTSSFVPLDEALARATQVIIGKVGDQVLVYGKAALPDIPGVYLESEILLDDGSRLSVVQDVAVTPLTDGTVRLGYRGCAHLLAPGQPVAVLAEPSDAVPGSLYVIPGNAYEVEGASLRVSCEDSDSMQALIGKSLDTLVEMFNAAKAEQ